ncbi:MAG: hypothetical protein K2P17_05215 [Helicobacteraceae bacterium]|nr:hypothetical protein [Helicobacteraceae bacterium]
MNNQNTNNLNMKNLNSKKIEDIKNLNKLNTRSKELELSTLNKTWIFDIDGTILKHNGFKIDGFDTLLEGAREFFSKLSPNDVVILLTAREQKYIKSLKSFLKANNIRYDYLIPNLPNGERILINDNKPSGLKMAFAINKARDSKLKIHYKINNNL